MPVKWPKGKLTQKPQSNFETLNNKKTFRLRGFFFQQMIIFLIHIHVDFSNTIFSISHKTSSILRKTSQTRFFYKITTVFLFFIIFFVNSLYLFIAFFLLDSLKNKKDEYTNERTHDTKTSVSLRWKFQYEKSPTSQDVRQTIFRNKKNLQPFSRFFSQFHIDRRWDGGVVEFIGDNR